MTDPCTCETIRVTRKGICEVHHMAPVTSDVLEEIRRRQQSVIRRYLVGVAPQPDAVETLAEEVSEKGYSKIQELKSRLGLGNIEQVIDFLAKEMSFRGDPERSLAKRTPLIVVGPPASGKTILTKKLITHFEKVFVVDVSHEYDDLELVNIGSVLGNVWEEKSRFRVWPSDNPMYSKLELEMTFGILTGKMKEPNSPLAPFCFVLEDAVRFANIETVRAFIAESRKFLRKVIVVCQDPKAYEGLGEVVKV